jgi:hypothetical protein
MAIVSMGLKYMAYFKNMLIKIMLGVIELQEVCFEKLNTTIAITNTTLN